VQRVGFQLFLITDGLGQAEAALATALGAAEAGSVAVQLRNRTLGGAALLSLAERLAALTRAHGAPLFINDRVDIAVAVAADGVHLPAHGLPVAQARALLGQKRLISAATHSLPEVWARLKDGADCVTFGPIWPTPSKPDDPTLPAADRVSPVGLEGLAAAVAVAGRQAPLFALGGIDTPDRAAACAATGARIACLRAVLAAPDPGAAVRRFLAALRMPRTPA
jgi:thiamine-phosphate pyrophosphorylase